MAIVKMKHLRLAAMQSDREALLRLLQGMGCLEIEEPVSYTHLPSSSRLTTYVFLAIVAILMVLGLVMLLQARKNGGVWSLAGREVRVLPAEAGYSLIFLTLAVNVVAVAAAAVMGGNVGYYLIYVLVAWLFALLVYYTVKRCV